jgi:hypothetical protein
MGPGTLHLRQRCDGDGWFVIMGGALAGAMLVVWMRRGQRPWWPCAIMGLAGLVGIGVVLYDGNDIFGTQTGGDGEDSLFGDTDLVTPGWGIIMAGVGSASLIAASLAAGVTTRNDVASARETGGTQRAGTAGTVLLAYRFGDTEPGLDRQQHQYLLQFPGGTSGLRYFAQPLELGAEILDGDTHYRIARLEQDSDALDRAWAEIVSPPTE